MQFSSLQNPERRRKHLSRWTKKLRRLFAGPVESTPVFVVGKQRSGTTMLMIVLELHPDTEIYDEAHDSAAFDRYCLRPDARIQKLVERSRAPFVCFKPLMDSHRVPELLTTFPNGRVVWMARDPRDVANSTLRKFAGSNDRVRAFCEGREPDNGIAREVSAPTLERLRELYRPDLSEFDVACLEWWIRNRIVVDQGLDEDPRVRFVRYERLVESGAAGVHAIFDFLGLRPNAGATAHVHARSVGRHPAPPIDSAVGEACDELLAHLGELAPRVPA